MLMMKMHNFSWNKRRIQKENTVVSKNTIQFAILRHHNLESKGRDNSSQMYMMHSWPSTQPLQFSTNDRPLSVDIKVISIDNTLEDKIKDEKRNPDLYSVYMAQASIRATNGQIFELLQYSLTEKIRYLWYYLSQISERTISRLPISTHQNNRYEQYITERCIQQSGKTLQDVISDWIVKFNNREIDRSRLPLLHAETITVGTFLCYDCYEKLVAFLLYWYRVSMPKHLLPPDASQREDCWYGYECRTQHHSEDHAQKRNHVCRPTRGTHRT
ncbi:E3 ubiquitin-protein ligase CHFR [Cinnamomum micranthum f. kanehirae]|uniref:E3 ubiquitin-protein ligase CHFR n=1 Tax=Cinnamomum micranthum f. kanehirae TaxID=337451 RepID=A0A443P443_9MAGN|nr:E3 ubiquitin-protein ligase CHFR [Cinnamomum micranthum f. kanehirae]